MRNLCKMFILINLEEPILFALQIGRRDRENGNYGGRLKKEGTAVNGREGEREERSKMKTRKWLRSEISSVIINTASLMINI